MNIPDIIKILEAAINQLPKGPEMAVLLTLTGNLKCGVSNDPMADHAKAVARQMLAELTAK